MVSVLWFQDCVNEGIVGTSDMAVALHPPVLEVYYSPTCAPCRLELPVLGELVRKDGSIVRIVILDQEQRARGEISAISALLERSALQPSKLPPRKVLLSAGDADGILPYARSIAPSGKTCATWRGGLTLLRARALLAACRITAPNSH
ncbi:MAG TPA: thioredoxin family protein [Rhizomicrobium sp.]